MLVLSLLSSVILLVYGMSHAQDTIVTSGIGYYGPPMRVGTDSEIAVINIHFAE